MEMPERSFEGFVLDYIAEVKRAIESLDIRAMNRAVQIIMDAYETGRTVYLIGNGGSASTASHMACDLGKGTLARLYDDGEERLRVVALTDNVALMTAYGNDLAYEEIFVQQLRNLVRPGDVAIVLSGSGNSLNVINAVAYAKRQGARTIGLLGFKTGGKLAVLVDCSVIVQSNHYGPVEDTHLMLNHIFTAWFAYIKKQQSQRQLLLAVNTATPFRVGERIDDRL